MTTEQMDRAASQPPELLCKCGYRWHSYLPATCPACDREYGIQPAARWAGSEPIERDAHEGCDCHLCCPPCAVEGCWDFDVTARLVPVDTSFRAFARVLLCEQHGRTRPVA